MIIVVQYLAILFTLCTVYLPCVYMYTWCCVSYRHAMDHTLTVCTYWNKKYCTILQLDTKPQTPDYSQKFQI